MHESNRMHPDDIYDIPCVVCGKCEECCCGDEQERIDAIRDRVKEQEYMDEEVADKVEKYITERIKRDRLEQQPKEDRA